MGFYSIGFPSVIYGYVLIPSKIQVHSVEMSWWTPNGMSYLANIFKNSCVEWTICYHSSFFSISSAMVGMRLKITYKSLYWLTSILVCVWPRYRTPFWWVIVYFYFMVHCIAIILIPRPQICPVFPDSRSNKLHYI